MTVRTITWGLVAVAALAFASACGSDSSSVAAEGGRLGL